jgi:hypothetical protein
MDAALKAAWRRQRYLKRSASLPAPSSSAAAAAAAMTRRPTITAHAPVLSG